MPTAIQEVIGDYKTFFLDLLERLSVVKIDVQDMPISHICYRVEDVTQYESVRGNLKTFSSAYAEHEFAGRLVSEFILKNPLDLGKGYSVLVVELLPPKSNTSYTRGLENFGMIVGKGLPEFKLKYKSILTGVKNRSLSCQPAYITFENAKTVKFYDRSLREIVETDGNKFFPIGV